MPPVLQTWAARGAGAPVRLSPIFAVSHRLSPLKVSAFFKRTLRPPAPPGGVFLHKAAHICSHLFVQTGELPNKLPALPHFVAFFCNKPPHFALWVKGLFHIHPPPSHGRDPPLKHFEMHARLRRAWRAGPGSIREPLLQASRALRPPAPGPSFPSAHKPRPHLENLTPPKPAHTGRPVVSPRSFSLTIPLHTPIIVSYGTERYFFNERSPLYDPRPAPCGAAQFSL